MLAPLGAELHWLPEVNAHLLRPPNRTVKGDSMIPATTAEAARRFANRIAYVSETGWPLTYAEIDRISDEVAAGLARRGVTEGSVVALVLPPGPQYLLAYIAAAKVGAITAGVNDRLSARERDAVLERAAPTLVLAAPGFVPEQHDAIELPDSESAATVLGELRIAGETPQPLADDPDRPVAIIFTSGTTGIPKGALYGNRQLAFITQTDIGDTWDGGGRSFSGTSFAHLGFMTKLPGSLRRGGTTFIMRRWRAADALALLSRERMTTVAGVPSQIALMLRQPDFDSYDLDSVGFIIVGGGPVTPGLAAEARAPFPCPPRDAVLVHRGRHRARNRVRRRRRGRGRERRPSARERRPRGARRGRQTRRSHAIGEVCLRSDAVMSGYWRDPEATRRVHRRRLRAHRRSRLGRRRGPPAARRSQQGDVRAGRLQRVPGRGRGSAVEPSGGRGGGDRAPPRSGDG